MHDCGTLPGEFGIDLCGNFVEICVEASVSPFGGKAGNAGQALCPAERLNIFVEDLIGGRRRNRLIRNFNVIRIPVRYSAILHRQARRLRGLRIAAMASPAGDPVRAAEVCLIDGFHHEHHLARLLFFRGVRSIVPDHASAPCRMTFRTIHTQRRGDETHRP